MILFSMFVQGRTSSLAALPHMHAYR